MEEQIIIYEHESADLNFIARLFYYENVVEFIDADLILTTKEPESIVNEKFTGTIEELDIYVQNIIITL